MNHFARFSLPPRPWLDLDLLKQRFLELSAHTHPDKASAETKTGAEQLFQELNESFNVLRHSRPRLLHLLEIFGVAKQEHVQNVPPEALAFFAEVATVTKQADALIKEKAAAHSPMLKVQLMDRGLEQVESIQQLQANLRASTSHIDQRLQHLNDTWTEPPSPATLHELAAHAAALGFLERWQAQLQERIGSMTF